MLFGFGNTQVRTVVVFCRYESLDVEAKWAMLQGGDGGGGGESAARPPRGGGTGSHGTSGEHDRDEEEEDENRDPVAIAHTLAYKACVCHQLWHSGVDWSANSDGDAGVRGAGYGASAASETISGLASTTNSQASAAQSPGAPDGLYSPLRAGAAAAALSMGGDDSRQQAHSGDTAGAATAAATAAATTTAFAASSPLPVPHIALRRARSLSLASAPVTLAERASRVAALDDVYHEAILALDIAQDWSRAWQLCERLRQVPQATNPRPSNSHNLTRC